VNIFFDIQGTLIAGRRPRPHTREVFLRLIDMGHHVYLWSSRGGAYAAHAAWLLGVEDLVFGCFGKAGVTPVSVDFVVDDQPSMAERYGGYAVAAFEGERGDRELLGIPEAVEAQGRERPARPT
jgi:hypothetical protein